MAGWEFERGGVVNYFLDLPVRALFGTLRLFPYRVSLNIVGWIAARILAPVFGMNQRVRDNLAHIGRTMPEADIRRLCREVAENSARLMVESFNIRGFLKHAHMAALKGPGKDALLNALKSGRSVVLVSGHFGNYQVIRVLLADLGYPTAAIYRPMNNAYSNTRYIDSMDAIAGPNFPRGLRGTKALLSNLRKNGAIAMLNDQAALEGAPLTFMGRTALTMTSAAEFALKYDADLFAYYGVRRANGVDFDVLVDAPLAHSSAHEMTQALNDSLEKMVERHPGQWFWVHRRWKWT